VGSSFFFYIMTAVYSCFICLCFSFSFIPLGLNFPVSVIDSLYLLFFWHPSVCTSQPGLMIGGIGQIMLPVIMLCPNSLLNLLYRIAYFYKVLNVRIMACVPVN